MQKKNQRIFVEKRNGFQIEAKRLQQEIKNNLGINSGEVRIILTYDLFDVEEKQLDKIIQTVLSEVMIDEVLESVELKENQFFAIETVAGQYDQRADSAKQCIRLLNPSSVCDVKTGKIFLFENCLTDDSLNRIKKYIINPLEVCEKDLSQFSQNYSVEITPLQQYDNFIKLDEQNMKKWIDEAGLAMSVEDALFVQEYFKKENRNPTEVELKVLDTYWSDHCRHTTFETSLTDIVVSTERFGEEIQEALTRYRMMRKDCRREDKPETLMDIATINSRWLRKKGLLDEVEISEEINACSVIIDVNHDGQQEKWLLQFKNETHNHPTEIEPFGGASTCIGGAIRDPLSGRAYVYQAMRVTGSGDIKVPLSETRKGKLPQQVISKKSAQGNSSYGNQIGLATSHVREIYHPGYCAKHMEVGAVVGAVKQEYVRRETPVASDVIVLLGGKTGRDGIGGATGSSKEHTVSSLEKCSCEVQKGNAPEERKIQRLFRNPECTKLIKKCNDFGAGGVCVAIGELADGLRIDLSAVPLKYEGLNAMEIAVSESQERMAVVLSKEDVCKFIELANDENLEATVVAEVTEENRLIMMFKDEVVVDLNREFLNSAGVRQHSSVSIETLNGENPFKDKEVTKESILAMLSSDNIANQKGLVEMFDSSIGSGTVLMPFGGKRQMTPMQASVHKIPVLDGKTDTCSILTYGFHPTWMEYSCFTGAMFSVLESMAKTVAVGGNLMHTLFSFQEYFERLNEDKARWGKVVEALLGAMKVQDYFKKAAIGGKDSMSGTFEELSVPPTLISFACTKGAVSKIVSGEMKSEGNRLSAYIPELTEEGYPNLESYQAIFEEVTKKIEQKEIVSAYVAEEGGLLEACFKMSFGNNLGFNLNLTENGLKVIPGAIVVETEQELMSSIAIDIGCVTDCKYKINHIELTEEEVFHAWNSPFEFLYPQVGEVKKDPIDNVQATCEEKVYARNQVDTPHVCIPVFPGTNCEYDMKRAFEDEGAIGEFVIFNNLTQTRILESISKLEAAIDRAHILALPGGFSSGDEPDGSAKFIVNVLQNEKIKAAIHRLLERDGLILGICNGFQALIKSGLLPYGEIRTMKKEDATLFHNDLHRHISTMAHTRIASTKSPWLQDFEIGEDHWIAMSHGEGKFVVGEEGLKGLIENGQVAFQYCDFQSQASNNPRDNINGSTYAIEGIISKDGKILGKMGHSERAHTSTFKNIPGNKHQNIFASGVRYFTGGKKNVKGL